MLVSNSLSERHARALLKLDSENVIPALQHIIERKLNVLQTEKYIDELLEKKNAPKRTTKRAFSNIKIFLNTVEGAIKTMQQAGVDADVSREDTGESVVYRIVIPKKAKC